MNVAKGIPDATFQIMAMRIPKNHLMALGKVAKFDQESLNLLLEIFRDEPPSLFSDQILEEVVEKLEILEEEARDIVRTLFSLYSSRVSHAHQINEEAFLANVYSSLQAEKIPFSTEEFEKLQKFLAAFIRLKGAIEFSSKSLNVLLENERNFISSRIITELRPVFKANPAEEPAGAVVVHTLKFNYREAGEVKEFFVTLDSHDLHELKHSVERCLIKEATVLTMSAKMNLPVLKPEN